jgi:hypothetical protein
MTEIEQALEALTVAFEAERARLQSREPSAEAVQEG